VANNIDEFFQKRIGGLKQQVGAGLHASSPDGRTPLQQIADCIASIHDLEKRKAKILETTLGELKSHAVWLAPYRERQPAPQAQVRDYYIKNIFPLVTPQAMDPAHPFPFVSDLSLNLLVTLHYPQDPEPLLARVKVPVGVVIPRFLRVPGPGHTFVGLEALISA